MFSKYHNKIKPSAAPDPVEPLSLDVQSVGKSFGAGPTRVEVLRDVTLSARPGEFVTVLGPSGSGKTTLLSIIAGLTPLQGGTVTVRTSGAGEPLTERLGSVGYMPQRDLLLPWRTALDNAAVGLEVEGFTRDEARDRVLPLFREFGLSGFESNFPIELSGGMRQRVSFLRSAVMGRGLMLLDEPFGALDAITRSAMQEWLLRAVTHLRSTFVLVTHDIDEAILLSDRVYVFSQRPSRVLASIVVPIARPRTLESTATPQFAALRGEITGVLRGSGILPAAEAVPA